MTSTPKYKQIMEYIKTQIIEGAYTENDKLPTEQFLAEKFNTSRPTVVKAMDRLRDLGFVLRVQGSGTFVCSNRSDNTSSSSNIISVVLPFAQYRNSNRSDELSILKGIQKQLCQHGYYTMIHYCNDNGMDFIETIKSVKKSISVGIIAYVAQDLMNFNEIYDLFMDNYPFVIIDQPIIGMDLPCVRSDNIKGANMATQHLVDCGYEVIYFLSDVNLNFNESIRERYIGYCQIVQRYKDDVNFNHHLLNSHSEHSINDAIQLIISKHPAKRIGIFCTGDYFAQRVYNTCINLGHRVPQEIGIVGFDGLNINLQDNRHLTTIVQNFYNIGNIASSTILKWIDTKTMPVGTIKTDVKLSLGDTTIKLI